MEVGEEEQDNFIKENPIIFKKYKVKKKLGEGAFGDVFLGQAINNNDYVAIKTEPRKIIKPILESEAFLLYSIAGPGIPEVKSFGKTKEYNILVEPLLGKSLFDIFAENHKSMPLADACLIGIQVIDRIQWVHSKYIVHRDIKPDNFLIGRKDPNVIYLIDFGLSKKYRSTTTGKHIRFGFTGKLTGTVRFASANALRGGEQSRRDDIESIGYMMIYFLKKKLPWQGVTGNKKMERYLKIYKMKKNMAPEKLCEGLYPEMIEFITYAKNLEFEQEPDYKYLKNLFKKMLKRIHNSNDQLVFSWIKMADFKAMKNPINPATRKDSPQNRIYKKIKSKLEKGRNLSSDSDSKTGSYGQVVVSSANNFNLVENNMLVSSEDQFETKDKKILNKSIRSKDGLNTTVANLDVSVDENIVDFENERINGESNKNMIEINRNLNCEFTEDLNKEQNKDENNIKEEKIKNKSLASNISDHSNKDKEDINKKEEKEEKKEKKEKEEKKEKDLIISDLIQNDDVKDDKNIMKMIDDNPINKEIQKKSLIGTDFTFNETLSSLQNNSNVSNNLKNNLTGKKELNKNKINIKENFINKKDNVYNLLTGKSMIINEEQEKKINIKNDSEKKALIAQEKKIQVNKNNIINKSKTIKTKIIKKSVKRVPPKKGTINNTKKIKLNNNSSKANKTTMEGTNSNTNKMNSNKEPEFDIIKQISNETNNNLYNELNNEMDFNFDIENLKKRPSAGPVFNPLSLNKKQANKNNNINFSEKKNEMDNTLTRQNKVNENENEKRRMYQVKSNTNFPSDFINYINEDNNDLFNSNRNNNKTNSQQKNEFKVKKISNKKIYQGRGVKTFKTENYIIPNEIINQENKNNNGAMPEDNHSKTEKKIKSKNKISNTNKKIKINNNNANSYCDTFNNNIPMNNEDMNSIDPDNQQNKYINNIKLKNKEAPNINRIHKNVKIVRLSNLNNNALNRISKSSINDNNQIYHSANSKVKQINNEFGKVKLINDNNNMKKNIHINNISQSTNHNLIYKKIMPNPQINYQFPVYINNNNNIYNTQYLNTSGNIPINPNNINQINQKFITIAPAPIQTNLNFGQNLGVQFVNTTPNVYSSYGSLQYYPVQNINAYEYQKKYNVSLIRK